ncbi:site-specific integrase [Kribbella yunnanensis]|uniref:Site-specific integrase n=1 Tax=Kribbella yunnanensis TaxID=190194 RepID=A0ABP4UT13_9ACTN
MKEPITKFTLKNGTVRYLLVVDIGRDKDGNRQQFKRRYDTLKEARAELSSIRHSINQGTYVKPSKETLNEYLDGYIVGATRGRRASTKASYRDAFRCPREVLGEMPLQAIQKKDVEDLVEYMETKGRRRGGTPGTGLGTRSIRLMLGRLTAAFDMAMQEGKLARNVVKLVTPPAHKKSKRDTWSTAQVRGFLHWAAKDRLHAAWRLSLYGLRRGEVLGLRWSDIDLTEKTLKVNQSRVLVDYKVLVEPPKSENGERTLPMDDKLVEALRALRKRQAADAEEAGSIYQHGLAELDWYTAGDAYVVTDSLGMPVHPEWYSDEFGRILKQAGVPRIRLHDSRHTTLSLMEKAGIPISIISKWAGHYDAAFTMKTYVHASDDDLKEGAKALAKLHAIKSA